MTKRLRILLLCALLVFTVSCSPQKKEPITIALTSWPGYAYAFIAQEKGFFEQNGVEVNLLISNLTSKSIENYHLGIADGFLDPFAYAIEASAQGQPTKVVLIADYSDSGDVIVGKEDLLKKENLRGKTFGFEGFNSFSHLFILAFLEKNGLDEHDVYLKNIYAQNVTQELDAESIDAGHTWEPAKSEALKKGYALIAKAGDFPGEIIDVLGFHQEIVEERPEDIGKIVRSLLEARQFLVENPDEAISIMAMSAGMTEDEMRMGVSGVIIPDLQENKEALSQESDSTWSLYRSGERIVQLNIGRGQMAYQPELESIIEPAFINKM